jgi:hypothetical protein
LLGDLALDLAQGVGRAGDESGHSAILSVGRVAVVRGVTKVRPMAG